tara:strand:- start:99 stop:695 length:597 start_codon:yes stop_codon:yes gene_type:complete
MNGDVKIGKLLCDEDIITRRQLNQALQAQVKGDKRTLGEILVDKGFCSLEDITDVILKHGNGHEKKQEEITEKIEEVDSGNEGSNVKELSEDTKFSMSVQTMIGIGTAIASVVGMYYMLIGEIEEAKELPSLETLYKAEYPSRPEGYNWPRSYEQYKDQVGSLQEDMDDVFDKMDELEEAIKELQKDIKDLERRKRDK